MSHRLTIVLTDAEYADLQQRAEAERRTPKQMAERLVAQPVLIYPYANPLYPPIITIQGPPWNPIWPPNVWCASSGTTTTPPSNGTICGDLTVSSSSLTTREGYDA